LKKETIRKLVKEISLKEAKPFIEKWHYSKRVPTGKNIFFGWYIEDQLYAVADYGIGVNSYQATFLSKLTNYNITNDNLLELKRLCRIEPKNEKLQLSEFLSKCHKELKKRGYKYIVAFSDPMYGHNGGIYKASNFIHMGKTNAEYHVIDKDGNIRHRRYPFRYAERHGCSIQEAREILGLKRIKTPPKDRWFIKIS
jgi:hypothetical protein